MTPMQVRQTLGQAISLHQQGQVAVAESLYRQILASAPMNPDALRLLGLLLLQSGRPADAIGLLEKSIEVAPKVPPAYNALGEAKRALNLFAEAEKAYRAAIKLNPQMPEPWNNLGNALHQQGRFEEAREAYRKAIAIKPDYLRGYLNLANDHLARRETSAALELLHKALSINPNFAQVHASLGEALLQQANAIDAKKHFEQSIRLDPKNPDVIDGYARALRYLDDLPGAIAAYRAAARLQPADPRIRVNLGEALQHVGQISAAIAELQQALELQPDLPAAHTNLASALSAIGKHDDAIAHLRKVLSISPRDANAHSNLLLHLHYTPADPREIFREHERWGEQHAAQIENLAPSAAADAERSSEGNRALRIGFVSPDFWRHPVSAFLEPFLIHRSRERTELFAYSDTRQSDEVTARLKTCFDHWQDTKGLSDDALAQRIRDDRIDVLVDLAGHTGGNRLLMFARKPAPVQVTYLGYPDTTGLRQMDYRITDPFADPPGDSDALHTEKLVRLPHCFLCYAPPEVAPEIKPRPDRPITFGSFNRIAKISTGCIELWARILRNVPSSRLLLKSTYLADQATRRTVRELFVSGGIPDDRLDVQPPVQGFANHLDAYNQIDIALDSFPYNGTTTTCEALWMGVPVVTLAGKTHVSRVGLSLLTNAALEELVAQTADDYVFIATDLAQSTDRLETYRSTLRQHLQKSPLLDARQFAAELESAIRTLMTANAK